MLRHCANPHLPWQMLKPKLTVSGFMTAQTELEPVTTVATHTDQTRIAIMTITCDGASENRLLFSLHNKRMINGKQNQECLYQ